MSLAVATWKILRIVPGGDGFAKLDDGRVGFASEALPGDCIRPLELDERRSYVRATTWELVEPGPERVEPPCAVADACGGCDWMRLDRAAQLRAKASVLREALKRTGGFHDLPEQLTMVTAGPELNYRSRVRLHISHDGRVGFFSRGTHTLVEIPACPVSAPAAERAMLELRRIGQRHGGALGAFSDAEIRVAPEGPPVSVRLFARAPEESLPEALLEELNQHFAVSIAGWQPHAAFQRDEDPEPATEDVGEERGDVEQRWPLPGGVKLYAPPEAFTQVNWAVNEKLVEAVVEGALSRGAKRFCDLYCGAGNFTLPLLAAGLDGMGIDRDRAGVRAARRAATDQGLPDSAFKAGDVRRSLRRLVREGPRFDLIVLDPPRVGARDVMPGVVQLGAEHVALCSCDPVTLARDLHALAGAGYVLDEVTGFDMFPHTHHLETLAWMRRETRPKDLGASRRAPREAR